MGKVLSVSSRVARRFNVDNRAERVISQEKPAAAPMYPSTKKEIELLQKDGSYEELLRKDSVLDNNLKQVYVVSHDPKSTKFGKPSEQNRLPQSRSSPEDTQFGYAEPIQVPIGKLTLKQASQIITNHMECPEKVTVESVVEEYKLSKENAENLLKYFSSFRVHMPETIPKLSASQKVLNLLKPTSDVSVKGGNIKVLTAPEKKENEPNPPP